MQYTIKVDCTEEAFNELKNTIDKLDGINTLTVTKHEQPKKEVKQVQRPKPYNGEWIDTNDRRAVENMFNSFTF